MWGVTRRRIVARRMGPARTEPPQFSPSRHMLSARFIAAGLFTSRIKLYALEGVDGLVRATARCSIVRKRFGPFAAQIEVLDPCAEGAIVTFQLLNGLQVLA